MEPRKLSEMEKREYDDLIENESLCRIAFKGSEYPKVSPFLYVFDGEHMSFLASKYGKKVDYFEENPKVCVEVESYSPDMSAFGFVALSGRLEEVDDTNEERSIRERFVDLIRDEEFSEEVLSAFGHSPDDRVEALIESERFLTWRLVDVGKIVGLGNGT